MKKNKKTRVNLIKLIEVFDERNDIYKGHTTPIIGFIGEDLNAAIFADYLIRRGKIKNVEILPYPVNTGQERVRGRELDRWIKAGNILYQTEIKSWCSFLAGKGRYKLPLGATEQEMKESANKKWEIELNEHFNNIKTFGKVSKVLDKMKVPDDLIKKFKKVEVEPLVIHWMPISKKEAMPFSRTKLKDLGLDKKFAKQIQKDFTAVNYFSCSLYIRELINKDKRKYLDLDLPNVSERVNIMEKLMK